MGILQRPEYGRHRAGHVLAMLHGFDAMPRVARSVGRHENRFDRVVFDHLFQRRISLVAAASLRQRRTPLGNQIADRRHRDVGMILKSKGGPELANSISGDPHADFPVRHRLPWLVGPPRRCDPRFAQNFRIGHRRSGCGTIRQER